MFFQFEADFVDSLRCIPMVVRYKLDTCGIKLKLAHWHKLSPEQREYLVEADCDTVEEIITYQGSLQAWILELTGTSAPTFSPPEQPDWLNMYQVPDQVLAELDNKFFPLKSPSISLTQWQILTPLQRFALIKLSRPGHENRNFLPALKEFNIG